MHARPPVFSAALAALLAALFAGAPALAQAPAGASAVPQSHIPTPVLVELRLLERQFEQALLSDCAPQRCYSKGCSYQHHVTVDLPRSGSLPGLGVEEGPGSVAPQEYLTEARCELAHEKSVPSRDVRTLQRRLEQRLSKAWLKVSVGTVSLDAVPASLREEPPPPEEKKPEEPKPEEEKEEEKEPPPPPPEWESKVALRELWLSLLPHFSWMIALFLGTLVALTLIWAARRLGRESLEEKAMAAQLAAELAAKGATDGGGAPAAEAAVPAADEEDKAFAEEQEKLWRARIAEAELGNDEGLLLGLLHEWLRAGQFELLAKAIFLFGDRLMLALSKDPELAVKKAELAEYLRRVDEKSLPSKQEFFRALNQHAVSAALFAQEDVSIYRSLREELGSKGVLDLLERMSARHGALLFAFAPLAVQRDVTQLMSLEQRTSLAEELLASTRISREDTEYLFEALKAARDGTSPPPPKSAGIADRGRAFDGAGALSVLLQHIEPQLRAELFRRALAAFGKVPPGWYEDILYPDMLLRIPDELRSEMLLDVDVRGLAAWFSTQAVAWQQAFLQRLPHTLQEALRANLSFASRAEQLRLAHEGHKALVGALKGLVARGKLSFTDLIDLAV